MNIISQQSAINILKDLANNDKHSILIEGPSGCGKTYIASLYPTMLSKPDVDIQYIAPNVNAIREAVDSCLTIQSPIILCIENLDLGLPAASYTLLKFLEEPTQHVYIIVTCRNVKRVPDTIISRSAVVNVAPPIKTDILNYATSKDANKATKLQSKRVWNCVTTFKDVDYILSLNDAQIEYFDNQFVAYMRCVDSISNTSWNICHFTDGAEIPVEFAIRYMLYLSSASHVKSACMSALRDIAAARIGVHAIICKLLFECKYGGG